MTIPFTPDSENPFPEVGSMDGFLQGAAFSALNNRTQASVTSMLQQQIQADSTWGGLWDLFWGFIKQPVEWVIEVFKTLFPWVNWEHLPEDFANILDWINDQLVAIPFFGTFIQGAETFVQALLRNIIEFFTNPSTGLLNALKALLGNAGALIGTIIESIVYWLTHPGQLLTGLINVLKDLFSNAGELIGTVINSIIYWLTHAGQPGGLGYLLVEGLKTLFTNAGGIIGTVIDSIVYWLTHPGPLVTGFVNMIRDGIANGGAILTAIFDAVTQWVTGGAQTLQQFFGGLWGNSTSLVSHVMDQVITAILGPYAVRDWTALTKWAGGLLTLDNLVNTIKTIFPWLSSLFPVLDTSDGSTVNLLNQGDFKTASTLNAASGWSWDSASNTTDGGGGSAKVTGFGSALKALYCNQYITVSTGDVLNLSAYVITQSFAATSGTKPITLDVIPYTGTSAGSVQKVADSGVATTFTKISGTYTVPAGVTSVRVRIAVSTDATAGTVWFDDIFLGNKRTLQQPLVNELTGAFGGIKDALVRNGRGTTPTTTMDYSSFFDATTSTTGLIGTIQTTADGASGNVQNVVDNIARTVGGSPGAVNQPPTTVTTNFQSFFNKLYGTTTPQNTVPQGKITDLTGAFGGVKDALARNGRGTTPSTTLDYTSFFDTTTATTGLIGTAAAQADLGVGNAQKLSDGLVQTVGGGGSTTGVPANTRTYFENFFNKLYGNGVSTPQTYITNSTINGLPTTRLSGTISQGQITDGAVSTAKLASTVVSDIATSVKSTTVGTGAVMARINPAGAHVAIATGQTTFGTASNPFFNTLTRTTTDITTPTASVTYSGTTYTFYTGEFVVTNPGWYMCEVGLRINVGNGIPGTGTNYGGPGASQYTGNYNFTPILYLKPSGGTQEVHRYGTEVMGVMNTIAGQRQGRFANSSWIVYLSAGDSVQAGYSAGVIDNNAGGNRIGFFGADNTGKDSYFAIALLNRS